MKKWKWPLIMLVQLAAMTTAGLVIALADLLGPWIYGTLIWLVMPVLCAASAYRATRRGLLNYAAWILPPCGMALGHRLLWGYLPSPGPVLLSAFIALVGAAAGEVMNQRTAK